MGDTRPSAPDVKLYELLDTLDALNMPVFSGTGYIACTSSLISHLQHEVFDYEDVPFPDRDALEGAFKGQPVKQVWNVARSYKRKYEHPQDWLSAIRRRAEIRRESEGTD